MAKAAEGKTNGRRNAITENRDRQSGRLEFEVPVQRIEEFDELKARLGMTTRRELLSLSIAVIRAIVGELEEGREIGSVDKSSMSYRPFVMPFQVDVKPHRQLRLVVEGADRLEGGTRRSKA